MGEFLIVECPRWDSNPHGQKRPRNFKSLVATITPLGLIRTGGLGENRTRV